MADADRMAAEVAALLGCRSGNPGGLHRRHRVNLKMDRVVPAIHAAVAALAPGKVANRTGHHDDRSVSEGTAVTVRERARQLCDRRHAKGVGMIDPTCATMLGFLTTYAKVRPSLLRRALEESAGDTFNAITVDGECSPTIHSSQWHPAPAG